MTPKEAEQYRTWAMGQSTKHKVGLSIASISEPKGDEKLITTVSGIHQGLSYSATIQTPLSKPRAEADEAFLECLKRVQKRIQSVVVAQEKHRRTLRK